MRVEGEEALFLCGARHSQGVAEQTLPQNSGSALHVTTCGNARPAGPVCDCPESICPFTGWIWEMGGILVQGGGGSS